TEQVQLGGEVLAAVKSDCPRTCSYYFATAVISAAAAATSLSKQDPRAREQ
ncbi:unnamed protein product, partial [Amoebophrya sp. A120]